MANSKHVAKDHLETYCSITSIKNIAV